MARTGPLALALAALLASPVVASTALDSDGPNGPLAFDKQVSPVGISWSLTGVPDIDQARGTNSKGTKVGLPNDGLMYCVPTTGMDFLAFLADRGFEGLGVPSKDWTLAKNFNEMSVLLAQLGGEMGTDPAKGTGGAGFVEAMTARLADSELGALQLYYAIDEERGEPTIADVIESGADGALLAAGVGFYKDEGEGDDVVKRRTGGHVFTVVGAQGPPGATSGTLFTRDPGTVYVADTEQGPYTTDAHTIAPFTADFVYEDKNGKDQVYEATRATWDGKEGTLFEGFWRIVPKSAWGVLGEDLIRIPAFDLVPDPGPLHEFALPGGRKLEDLALSAATGKPAFLVKGSARVYELDPLSGRSHALRKLKGARALTFGGPLQTLYVAGARKLLALDRGGKVVDSRRLSAPIDALAFDERTDTLVGISKGSLKLFSGELRALGSRALPRGARRGKGEPLLAVGPSGDLVLGKAGQKAVFETGPSALVSRRALAAGRLDLTRTRVRTGGRVRGLAVDDLGRTIVSAGGRLQVLDERGRRVRGSPLDGRAADALFAITRSFDNTTGVPFLDTLDETVGPPPPFVDDPPDPAPSPDLVIGALAGSDAIVVENVGDAAAGPFSVEIADASGARQTVRFTSGLGPGEQAAVERHTCRAGRTFTADSAGEVAESQEGNNAHACPG